MGSRSALRLRLTTCFDILEEQREKEYAYRNEELDDLAEADDINRAEDGHRRHSWELKKFRRHRFGEISEISEVGNVYEPLRGGGGKNNFK